MKAEERKKSINSNELLDFCRAKKLFDKGFGFLTSLYHKENIFFHFSKIRNSTVKERLFKMERGTVSLFFTSEEIAGKRRAKNIWTNLKDVPQFYINPFVDRLILELNEGETNPFEIIDALHQLKELNYLTEQNITDIQNSKKCIKNPSVLEKLFD